jgi:RNA polymerase sigma-70 factor, ECF subfamily
MSDPPTEPGPTRPPAEPSSGTPASADATSDEMLLLGARVQDEAALGMLYDRYGELVYTLTLRIVGDRDLAEDVAHDAFIRAWHGPEQYDPSRGTLPGWLLAMARRQALAVLRGRPRRSREDDGEPDGGSTGPDSGTTGAEDELGPRSIVGQALAELTEAQREVIEAAYYDGLTQTEVADRLDEEPETVKVRIRDGLRRLRRELGPMVDAGMTPGRGTS